PRCPIIGRENAAIVFADTSTGPGVKSLSCGSTELIICRFGRFSQIFLLRDKANVAAAFHAGDFYFGNVIHFRVEPQIFVEIVFGNVVATHDRPKQIAIFHDYFGTAFDENAERMGVISDERQHPMNQNDDDASSDGGEKRGAAVDSAGKNGCEDDDQHGIERGLARERTFVAKPDHNESCEEDDDAAQGNLHEREIFWSEIQAKKRADEMLKRIHIKDVGGGAKLGEHMSILSPPPRDGFLPPADLRDKVSHGIRARSRGPDRSVEDRQSPMPIASQTSDVAIETRVFWLRF